MTEKKIKINKNELWPLLNIINEICYGINISNFEHTIGAKREILIELMNKISREEEKEHAILTLNDCELAILKNSFKEIYKQIEDWEFQTRIGISIQNANNIKDKLTPYS